jgi:hypothetical protein
MDNNNSMKIIAGVTIGIAIFAIAVVVLVNSDSQSPGQQVNAASLSATESFFDFGVIPMSGGVVEKQYTLTNTGGEKLTIGKVYTSCLCTTASIIESDGTEKGKFGMPGHKGQSTLANSVVEPGESITVNAVYDPAAHGPSGVGLAQRSIYLETDSKETPKVELRLKAMVTN